MADSETPHSSQSESLDEVEELAAEGFEGVDDAAKAKAPPTSSQDDLSANRYNIPDNAPRDNDGSCADETSCCVDEDDVGGISPLTQMHASGHSQRPRPPVSQTSTIKSSSRHGSYMSKDYDDDARPSVNTDDKHHDDPPSAQQRVLRTDTDRQPADNDSEIDASPQSDIVIREEEAEAGLEDQPIGRPGQRTHYQEADKDRADTAKQAEGDLSIGSAILAGIDLEEIVGAPVVKLRRSQIQSDNQEASAASIARLDELQREWEDLIRHFNNWATRGVQAQENRIACQLRARVAAADVREKQREKDRENLLAFCKSMRDAYTMLFAAAGIPNDL